VPGASRSVQSLRFEAALRATTLPGAIPPLADIDFGPVEDLMPCVALIHPDRDKLTLKFAHAGEGISELVGHTATGLDYLDLVDPAIKGDAFDATFVMLTRPCGLWQLTPGLTVDGKVVMAEYTGFPVFDADHGRGLIAMLAHLPMRNVRIAIVQRSVEWEWLELRGAAVN
jgi:hypothetical protein